MRPTSKGHNTINKTEEHIIEGYYNWTGGGLQEKSFKKSTRKMFQKVNQEKCFKKSTMKIAITKRYNCQKKNAK